MYIEDLIKLCQKAWSLTVLALIANGTAARVAVLAHEAATSRSAMTPSVLHLVALGLLRENPGHGHPLRAESVLTPAGERLATIAGKLLNLQATDADRRLCRATWILPILRLAARPVRFTHLQRGLAPITDRTLALSLQRLEKHGWLERTVDIECRPPRVEYQAVGEGLKLSRYLVKVVDAPERREL